MKYSIEATIPVVQYGNIKPLIEVDSIEAEEEALETIKRLWNRFGETAVKDKTGGGVEVLTFTGEVIYYDDFNHIYTDVAGNKLLSGSKYAEKFSPKFDKASILPKTAKSWEVVEADLDDIWKLNSDISTNFGNAVHKALELAHKHWATGAKIQDKKSLDANYIFPKNKYLADIVNKFVVRFGLEALPEVVVSDVPKGMVGTIDRLQVDMDTKQVRVGDYKTNNELTSKDIAKYQKQLSFYAHILNNRGYTVTGLDLFHWDGEDWVLKELEIVPLEGS